jgi:hypothetical protein
MRLVMRPLGDPAPEPLFFLGIERQIGIRRRHRIGRVGGEDFFAQQAFLGFARHDRMLVGFLPFRVSIFRHIQAQARLAAGLVRPVTLETAVGEDGPDIAIELERFGPLHSARKKYSSRNTLPPGYGPKCAHQNSLSLG